MLQIAKSENIGSRLQFASIAGCRTRSVEIYRVVFAWCKLLPILHFRLFLVAIDSAVSLLLPSVARQHTILDTRWFLQSPLDPVFRASYVLSRSRSCVCLSVC